MQKYLFVPFLLFSALLFSEEAAILENITLQQAECYALEFNFAVRALEHLVKARRYDLYEAVTRWLPRSRILKNYTMTDLGLTFDRAKVYETIVAFEEEIFNPSIVFGIQISRAEACRIKSELDVLRNDTLFQVRVAYYNYILATEQLKVEEENIELLKEEYNRDYEKLKYGESTAFDVNQSQTSVANAYTTYYAALRNVDTTKNELTQVMGLDPFQEVTVAESTIPIESIPLLEEKIEKLTAAYERDPDKVSTIDGITFNILQVPSQKLTTFPLNEVNDWTEKALSCRPELMVQKYEFEFVYAQLRERYGEYLPTISGFANWRNTKTNGNIVEHRRFWEFGVSVNFLLFDSFGRDFRVKAAKETLKSSLNEYRLAYQETQHLVSNTFYVLEQSLRTYLTTKQGVILAEEALDYAKQSRDLGEITPIEYREAAAGLTRARGDHNRARFDLIQAYFNLIRLSGKDAYCYAECFCCPLKPISIIPVESYDD